MNILRISEPSEFSYMGGNKDKVVQCFNYVFVRCTDRDCGESVERHLSENELILGTIHLGWLCFYLN